MCASRLQGHGREFEREAGIQHNQAVQRYEYIKFRQYEERETRYQEHTCVTLLLLLKLTSWSSLHEMLILPLR